MGKEIQRKYKWSKKINFVKWTPATELQVNLWKSTILDTAAKAKNQGPLWTVEAHKVHATSNQPSQQQETLQEAAQRRQTQPRTQNMEHTVFQALNTSTVGGAHSSLRGIFSLRSLQSNSQYLRSSQCTFVTIQHLDCENYIPKPAKEFSFFSLITKVTQ